MRTHYKAKLKEFLILVAQERFELSRPKAHRPKRCVSTYSTTEPFYRAFAHIPYIKELVCSDGPIRTVDLRVMSPAL